MFFCCRGSKTLLNCDNAEFDDVDAMSNIDLTAFKVCPQIVFTQFTKFIYFNHFLSFKKNYSERNSISAKKENKQRRIIRETKLLKTIHMEHIANNKNNLTL